MRNPFRRRRAVPDLSTREGLVEHLKLAHGWRDDETDPSPAAAEQPGTFGIVNLSHPVWSFGALQSLHADDHSSYPETGTPVDGHAHSHEES